MENAKYHSTPINKNPKASIVEDMKNWLLKINVNFNDNLDEHIMKAGYEVLCFPPYHCQFSAIELAWSHCKIFYGKHTGVIGNNDEEVRRVWAEALQQIPSDSWTKSVKHVENNYFELLGSGKKTLVMSKVNSYII